MKRSPQCVLPVWVKFHCDDPSPMLDQRERQRTGSCTNVNDEVAWRNSSVGPPFAWPNDYRADATPSVPVPRTRRTITKFVIGSNLSQRMAPIPQSKLLDIAPAWVSGLPHWLLEVVQRAGVKRGLDGPHRQEQRDSLPPSKSL